MARPLRLQVPNGVYHVTARGNAKQEIYKDDTDRRAFLGIVDRALARHGWSCLAYCLMGNHYHLLVRTPRANLAAGMQAINAAYASSFNRRYDLPGHVFQGRYSAVLVQRDAHLLEIARYIARNPVRAGLCRAADDWAWSSHRAVLGMASNGFMAVDEILLHFGGRERYRDYVEAGDGPPAIRQADAILGDTAFRSEHLPRRPSPEIAMRPWEEIRPPLRELLKDEPDLNHAIARAYCQFGYRMREIAEELGCHYSTVSRRIRAWELGKVDAGLQDLTP